MNSEVLRNGMPPIYSEEVFEKMIKIDLRELRKMENVYEFMNVDTNENVNSADCVRQNEMWMKIVNDVNENYE